MQHIPALDGLRASAIIIVVLSHMGFGHIVPGGFGVTVFFALSGYLITTLLREELRKTGTIDLMQFYVRRAIRILPPMYLAISLAVALSFIGLSSDAFTLENIWTDFLFLTNYANVFRSHSSIAIPLWSLDIEEHFYLAFPLFLLITSRTRKVLYLVVCCALVLFLRLNLVDDHGSAIYYWTHTRIDSILYGCVLALWKNPIDYDRPKEIIHWSRLGVGLALIVPTFIIRDPVFRETFRYSLQGIGLMLVFSFCIQDRGLIFSLLYNRLMVWIAAISYSLYLVHFPLKVAFEKLFPATLLVSSTLALLSSLIISELIRQRVELPLLRWRKRHLQPVGPADFKRQPAVLATQHNDEYGRANIQRSSASSKET